MKHKNFYYHFEDIYALLRWTLEEDAIEVVKHFNLLVDYEEAIAFIMDYIEQNWYMLNCAYDSIGRDELRRFLFADCHEIIISIISYAENKIGKNLSPDYKKQYPLEYKNICQSGKTFCFGSIFMNILISNFPFFPEP